MPRTTLSLLMYAISISFMVTVLAVGVLLMRPDSQLPELQGEASIQSRNNLQPIPYQIVDRNTKNLNVKIAEFDYYPEISPMVFWDENINKYVYILSSAWTWICVSEQHIMSDTVNDLQIPREDCTLASQPELLSYLDNFGFYYYKEPQEVGNQNWRFSYDGVMGYAYQSSQGKSKLITVHHNEHQNTVHLGKLYQGRIYPDVSAQNCASQYVGDTYQHCWPSFASFASVGTLEWSDESELLGGTILNQGPIAWPSTPRVNTETGTALYSGEYHPTLFSDGSYLYSIYVKNWEMKQSGGGEAASCFAMSRAPLNDYSGPSWINYDGWVFQRPSLPPGLTQQTTDRFYGLAGGTTQCLTMAGSSDPGDRGVYFSIAKIKDSDYYIGVEESMDRGSVWQVGIRYSRNLVDWTELQVLSRKQGEWIVGDLTYPTFLSADGRSNHEIDASNFYIIGKEPLNGMKPYKTNYFNLSIDLKDIRRAEQFIQQYYKELLNFDIDPAIPAHTSGFNSNWHNFNEHGPVKVLSDMIESQAFRDRNLNNEQFVAHIYRAVLSRDPDNSPNGSQWWVQQLNSGSMTRQTLIQHMYQGWEPACVYDNYKLYKDGSTVCVN